MLAIFGLDSRLDCDRASRRSSVDGMVYGRFPGTMSRLGDGTARRRRENLLAKVRQLEDDSWHMEGVRSEVDNSMICIFWGAERW